MDNAGIAGCFAGLGVLVYLGYATGPTDVSLG